MLQQGEEAGELGFDALAKELFRLAQNPVMLLYLCDGDFWGYDLVPHLPMEKQPQLLRVFAI